MCCRGIVVETLRSQRVQLLKSGLGGEDFPVAHKARNARSWDGQRICVNTTMRCDRQLECRQRNSQLGWSWDTLRSQVTRSESKNEDLIMTWADSNHSRCQRMWGFLNIGLPDNCCWFPCGFPLNTNQQGVRNFKSTHAGVRGCGAGGVAGGVACAQSLQSRRELAT